MGYNTDAYMRKKSRTKKQQEREQRMSRKENSKRTGRVKKEKLNKL